MKSNIEIEFRQRAERILNGSLLVVKDKKYRIHEIEFYYFEKDVHEDKYTHCDRMQLEYDFFYPHRMNGKSYKCGTYKCMDIAFGNKEKGIYYGVLIRSIRNIETGQFYTGPCISVNELLSNYGVKEWRELDENVISFVNSEFKLVDAKLDQKDIFVGARVGLSDKYPEYKDKEYRYATDIKEIKKQKIFRQLI